MASNTGLVNPLLHPFLFLFQIFQWLTDKLLSPKPPNENARLGRNRPKVAVIGAGITGVTSAAHCIGHGFDVVIFEAGSKDNVGGIWSVSYTTLWCSIIILKLINCRESMRRLDFRSIHWCIDSILLFNGIVGIPTVSKFSVRLDNFGNAMASKKGLASTQKLTAFTKMTKDDGLSTILLSDALAVSLLR